MTLHDFDRVQERLADVSDPVGFLINLFAHSPVGFAVWTADGSPLLTNRAFMDIFGVEPPPGYNVLEDDVLAKSGMLALFQRAFAGEIVHIPTFWYDPRELEVVQVTEGRRVAMSMVIFPLFGRTGAIEFVAATYKDDTELMLANERLKHDEAELKGLVEQMEKDIAERQRLQEERARLEAQLRQSQKLEALGTLAGGIAHDFNNLLTVILGNTQLAREQVEDPEASGSLGQVYEAAVRAAALVRRILVFGRPDEHRLTSTKLEKVVAEALKLLRATVPAMVEIRFTSASELPPVLADPTQVHQVIMNLGTNAAHAMESTGGVLDIRIDTVAVSEELAQTSPDLTDGDYVRVVVEDSGHGIETGILSRIFEPFFTTKPVGRGSGLGLSVVHGIMRGHGGAVTVYSEPGRGTKFHLYFPATRDARTSVRAAAEVVPRGNGQHVLVLDDEEGLAFLMSRVLKRLGYRVTTHHEAARALQDFRSRPHDFEAIVTDHSMPGMSGIELSRRVRELRPDVPIVVVSGYFRPEDSVAARAVGVAELILKPGSIEEIAAALQRAMNSTPTP